MAITVFIINGPNLNLLGRRETDIYGSKTLDDIKLLCKEKLKSSNFELFFCQSNSESKIIDWIQTGIDTASAIIINPAGFTHTSIAILDALKVFEGTVVEVHLSDISKREDFRRFSYVSERADKIIKGKGPDGYLEALDFVLEKFSGT